ncbi:hypothetical protein D3C73_1080200 [compost metagenome]
MGRRLECTVCLGQYIQQRKDHKRQKNMYKGHNNTGLVVHHFISAVRKPQVHKQPVHKALPGEQQLPPVGSDDCTDQQRKECQQKQQLAESGLLQP